MCTQLIRKCQWSRKMFDIGGGEFFSVTYMYTGNSVSVHRGFAGDPLRNGRNLVGR